MNKFYDIMRLTDSIAAVELADFLTMHLVMCVTMYLAPRILTVNGCCSGPVQPY